MQSSRMELTGRPEASLAACSRWRASFAVHCRVCFRRGDFGVRLGAGFWLMVVVPLTPELMACPVRFRPRDMAAAVSFNGYRHFATTCRGSVKTL